MPRLIALALLAFLAAPTSSTPPLRGFTQSSAAAERDLERRYQAIPNPDNMREYMRVISEEPHHAGSPGSRKVAEYVLGKFQSWGLDA